MTSCKSGRKHMHRKPNKSRKVRKSNNLNRKSAKGSRKNSQKEEKKKAHKKEEKENVQEEPGDRMKQVMSMIRSRFSKREEEPPKYLEEQTLDMNSSEDYPEDCLALTKGDPKPCNQSKKEERKTSYKKQA